MIMSTVFFVFISTAIIIGLSAMVNASDRLSAEVLRSKRSLYLAEAGAEVAAYNLMHDLPIGEMPTIDDRQPTLEVETEGENQRLTLTGEWNGSESTVEVLLFASSTDSRIISWKEIK